MISIVGVLYAVLISFVVVVVWQQYNDADANYAEEVSAVADAYVFARALPAHERVEFRSLVGRYVDLMIAEEWPDMKEARSSRSATETLARLSNDASGPDTASPAERVTLSRLQEAVQRMFDRRNLRLAANVETLPPVLWAALLTGAIVTVLFAYFFGVKSLVIQLTMTAGVALVISLMFTLLIELDFPFRRDTAISPDRWIELRAYLQRTEVFRPVIQRSGAGGTSIARLVS